MNYPVEKEGIRFYNYYFHGVEKPLSIEARSKAEARDIMRSIKPKLSNRYNAPIVGETVVIPLRGVSEKVIKGIKYIWVGEDKAQGGWLSESAYKQAIAISKQKARR